MMNRSRLCGVICVILVGAVLIFCSFPQRNLARCVDGALAAEGYTQITIVADQKDCSCRASIRFEAIDPAGIRVRGYCIETAARDLEMCVRNVPSEDDGDPDATAALAGEGERLASSAGNPGDQWSR